MNVARAAAATRHHGGPDTQKWEVRWREGGSRRSRSFDRKGDAERFATAVERRLQLGGLVAGADITLNEWAQQRFAQDANTGRLKPPP